MALSTNIYAEVTTTFPASVVGSGAVTVTKSGGFYTIGYDGSGVPVNSVGNGKLVQVAASRLIGNPTGATADRSEISLGGDLEFSGSSLQGAALTGDVTKAAGSTTTAISAGAVGTNELAPDAVNGTRISDNSIDSEHYVDASIDSAHIANDQIDSQHYAAASIGSEHIAYDQVDSQHYAGGSIDHEHLGEDVITGATNRTAFESGDKLLIHETGVGLRKIDYDDLPSGGGATFATAAEVRTGTETAKAIAPATAQDHESAVKAWVSFNGVGTVTIGDSYNVSSVTDNGTGHYTVNFTTPFTNANYGASLTCENGSSNEFVVFNGALAAGSCTIYVLSRGGGVPTDNATISGIFAGTQ